LDRFPAGLGYSAGLLIGFDAVEVDHGGRLPAMGGVRPLVVVKGAPPPDASLGLGTGFPGVQVDAFILQGPPEAFDEDIVEAAALPNVRNLELLICSGRRDVWPETTKSSPPPKKLYGTNNDIAVPSFILAGAPSTYTISEQKWVLWAAIDARRTFPNVMAKVSRETFCDFLVKRGIGRDGPKAARVKRQTNVRIRPRHGCTSFGPKGLKPAGRDLKSPSNGEVS
jgi:hypothetical protein